MKKYILSECHFTETIWNHKSLYAVRTVLVGDNPIEKIAYVIGLGDDFLRVKNIAKAYYNGACLDVYIERENYKSENPFYLKDGTDVKRNLAGMPILKNVWESYCAYYKKDELFFILGNDIERAFEYEVQRGNIIYAIKRCNKWCLPDNLDQILAMKSNNKTRTLCKEELLG